MLRRCLCHPCDTDPQDHKGSVAPQRRQQGGGTSHRPSCITRSWALAAIHIAHPLFLRHAVACPTPGLGAPCSARQQVGGQALRQLAFARVICVHASSAAAHGFAGARPCHVWLTDAPRPADATCSCSSTHRYPAAQDGRQHVAASRRRRQSRRRPSPAAAAAGGARAAPRRAQHGNLAGSRHAARRADVAAAAACAQCVGSGPGRRA